MSILPKAWQNLMSSSGLVPFVVKAIDRVLGGDWSMEPSTHDHYELVYMKRGEAVFRIEDAQVRLLPNNIVIIKPNRKHELLVQSKEGCEFVVFSFMILDNGDQMISRISMEDFIDFMEGEKSEPCLLLKVGQRNEVIQLLNKIISEKNSREPDAEFMLRLLVLEVFVQLSRALRIEWENSMKGKSPKLRELVKISTNYISTNYENDLKLADIANFVYLSPSYFTKVFRQEVRTSPINYLLKVRIDKSKEMLSTTDMNIGEVSSAVGFSSHQRFNEIFKKNTGMTPSEYRKRSGTASQ